MAKRKVNKSEAIRAYQKDHPSDGPTAVADAVSKQLGVKISASFVSNVKSNSGGKKKGKGKRGPRGASNGKPDLFDGIKAVRQGLIILGHQRFLETVSMLTNPQNIGG